jgi:hypothetical protein
MTPATLHRAVPHFSLPIYPSVTRAPTSSPMDFDSLRDLESHACRMAAFDSVTRKAAAATARPRVSERGAASQSLSQSVAQ